MKDKERVHMRLYEVDKIRKDIELIHDYTSYVYEVLGKLNKSETVYKDEIEKCIELNFCIRKYCLYMKANNCRDAHKQLLNLFGKFRE
ncbi:MAG: hypothetical protein ACLSTJ_01680 [Clostridium neonatale]